MTLAKKPIKITEVVLRDAHQSLLATRMTMDEMRPYIDGYYLITPFNRVEIIADMITYIHKQ